MGIFDMFKSSPTYSVAQGFVISSQLAANNILEPSEKTIGAIFEVTVMNLCLMKTMFKELKPHIYYHTSVKDQIHSELHNFALKYGIPDKLPVLFHDFLNNRIQLYGEELDLMFGENSDGAQPVRMAYNFFENPLQVDNGRCFDPQKIFRLMMLRQQIFSWAQSGIDKIIKEHKL
jgi:hypothetical protein